MSHGFGNARSIGPSGYSGMSGISGFSGFSGAATAVSTVARRKAADQSIGTGAWVDDDTLFFSIGANEAWVGEVVTFILSRSGDQLNPAIRISTGVSSSEFNVGTSSVDTDALNQSIGATSSTSTGTESGSFNCYPSSAGNHGHVRIAFSVKNGGSAGTFKVQWHGGSGGTSIGKGAMLFGIKV